MSNQDDLKRIYEQQTSNDAYDPELGVYLTADAASQPYKHKPKTYRGYLAGFGERLVAFIIDQMIITVASVLMLVVPSSFMQDDDTAALILLVSYAIYFAFFLYYYVYFPVQNSGRTFGKRITNIQIVRTDGSPVGYWRMFLRNIIGYQISRFVFALGYLWMLWDDENRTWHDLITDTLVIKA